MIRLFCSLDDVPAAPTTSRIISRSRQYPPACERATSQVRIRSPMEVQKFEIQKRAWEGQARQRDTDDDHTHVDMDQTGMEGSTDDAHSSHEHLHVPSVVVSGSRHGTSSSATSACSSSPNPYTKYLISDWLPQSYLIHSNSHSAHLGPTTTTLTPHDAYAHARGITPCLNLQDHNLVWKYALNVFVQVDVDRDNTG